MRVLVVSGIFPPDVGGPATHAYDMVTELGRRGHGVSVLTLTDGTRPERDGGVVRFPRRWRWPVWSAAMAGWMLRHRASYDVVYAVGAIEAATMAAHRAGRPVVARIVSDGAWERGRREGLTSLDFDEFQHDARPHRRLRAARRARNNALARCAAIVVPTPALGRAVTGWLGGQHIPPLHVIANGVRTVPPNSDPRNPDHPHGGDGAERRGSLAVLSVGRLIADKRVDVLVDALAMTPGVTLEVVGDGPERANLERRAGDRVCFTGALGHDEVMARLGAADALVMASLHEGLPHVVIEALAMGTPVVAAPAPGITETTVDGRDSLIVANAGPEEFAAALHRLRDETGLLESLRAGARESGRHWGFDVTVNAVEKVLAVAVAGAGAGAGAEAEADARGRPRAVFLGRTNLDLAPQSDLSVKFDIHRRHLDQLSVVVGAPGVSRYHGTTVVTLPRLRPRLLGLALFHTVGPVLALAGAARHPPSAVVCQSPYEAAGVIALRRLVPRRRRPLVQVEVHGHWEASARLYGGPIRRLMAPFSSLVARWALRRADRVRVLGPWLERGVRDAGYQGEIDHQPTFSDYGRFTGPPVEPLGAVPMAVFVGALERVKGVDVLLDAWPDVVHQVPGARLVVAGTGTIGAELRDRAADLGIDATVTFAGTVAGSDMPGLIDRSWCLVLPSRSEGMGRVVLEAMARGRAVVASRVGGIPDLVDDQNTAELVEPDDPAALARALARVLGDRDRAAAKGARGRARVIDYDPEGRYRAGVERLAAWIDEVR